MALGINKVWTRNKKFLTLWESLVDNFTRSDLTCEVLAKI